MADKNSIPVAIATLLVFFVVLFVATYFAVAQYRSQNPVGQQTQTNNQQQNDAAAGWNVVNNDANGFSFKYPSGYFEAGHEPKMLASGPNKNCSQVQANQCANIGWLVGNTTQASLKNENLVVNNVKYCQYEIADAAAGSRYYTDYYITVKNQECFAVELDTKTVVCENYLPLQVGNTEQEKNYNDCVAHRDGRENTLNQITSTFTFSK